MKIIWWPFAIVLFTDRLIPKRFGALVIWPFILIRPKYRHDEGLLQHELQHVRQLFRYAVAPFLLLYFLSRRFKLKMEVEAYRVQLKHAASKYQELRWRGVFAEHLAYNYGLNISLDEARAALE